MVGLQMAGRLAVVVGGGAAAEQKVAALLAAQARVVVVAPEVTPALLELEAGGKLEVWRRPWRPGDETGARVVVAATGVQEVDGAVAAAAEAAGCLVSVSGAPSLGALTFTAMVSRGPVQIGIATGGASPALARRIRQAVEQAVGPEYGELAELLEAARRRVMAGGRLVGRQRGALLRALADGPALALLASGDRAAAVAWIEAEIAEYV